MTSPPRITVAICTRNRAPLLVKAVDSIIPQLGEHSELLIVDNASEDSSAEVAVALKTRNKRIRLYREETLGIAHARNAALHNAQGDWVLFFDDDQLAPPRWLESYQRFFDRHAGRRIGAVGGGCEPRFESPPPKWYDVEWARYDLGNREFCLHGERTPGSGNCAYLRKAALDLNGFSSELARAEDTDLNIRLQKAGYEIWWLPDAAILHLIPGQRMTLRHFIVSGFLDGQSCATLRMHLQGKSRLRNGFYRATRIGFAPLQSAILLLLATPALPFRRGRPSARSAQRAARALGMAWRFLHGGLVK